MERLLVVACVLAGLAALPLVRPAAPSAGGAAADVRARWSEAIRPYGLNAVYPMREDLHVGDVLLYVNWICESVEQEGTASSVVHLGRISAADTDKALRDYYAGRPEFPASAAAGGTPPGPAAAPAGSPRMTRLAALPAVALGSFSSSELGLGSAETDGFLGRLGGSARNERRVTISLAGIEESKLPAPVMEALTGQFLASAPGFRLLHPVTLANIAEQRWARLRIDRLRACPGGNEERLIRIAFINRVFYARSIDFQFAALDASALTVALGRQASRSSAAPGEAATAAAAAAAASAAASASADGSGGTASLTIGESGTLTLKQTFDRPLAFGVDSAVFFKACELIASVWRLRDFDAVISRFAQEQQPKIRESLCPDDASDVARPGRRIVDAREEGQRAVLVAQWKQPASPDDCEKFVEPAERRLCELGKHPEGPITMPTPQSPDDPSLRPADLLRDRMLRPEAIQPNLPRHSPNPMGAR